MRPFGNTTAERRKAAFKEAETRCETCSRLKRDIGPPCMDAFHDQAPNGRAKRLARKIARGTPAPKAYERGLPILTPVRYHRASGAMAERMPSTRVTYSAWLKLARGLGGPKVRIWRLSDGGFAVGTQLDPGAEIHGMGRTIEEAVRRAFPDEGGTQTPPQDPIVAHMAKSENEVL